MPNISENRSARKYTPGEMLRRILWGFVKPLFRWSPRPLFGWRVWLLRLFGAKVGLNVHIYNNAEIYMPWNLEIEDWAAIGEGAYIYNLGKIHIGRAATVSQRAHLCAGTHDYELSSLPLLKPPIHIGANVWVCAEAFVGPGVVVGEGAVVAARAVVVKDVAPWMVVGGNPAAPIKPREWCEEAER